MNSTGKVVISFCLGAIAGGAASAIYFRRQYEKKLAIEADKIIKQVENSNIFEEYKDIINKETETDIGATNILTPNNEKPSEETEHPEDDDPDAPFIITEEEYSNDKLSYDKETLTFWTDDEVLSENETFNDEPEMVDAEDSIGRDMLDAVIESDQDEVFIRCPNKSADYDIVKKYDSYKEVIGM